MASKVTYVTLLAEEDVHSRYESALKRFSQDLDQYYPMYIGGDEVKSDEGEFDRRSPIDSSIVVGHFQRGTKKHARLAIAAANRSFKVWSRTPWQERVRVMLRAADLIENKPSLVQRLGKSAKTVGMQE